MDEIEKFMRELREDKFYTENEFITEVYFCLSGYFLAALNRDSNCIKVSLPNGQIFSIIIEDLNRPGIH